MSVRSLEAISVYDEDADIFASRYETFSTASIYAPFLHVYPRNRSALDIGCGSGRDAAWLVGRGNDVIAVDASDGMLEEAKRAHPEVFFMKDALPDLNLVKSLGKSFDFIHCAAMWQHVHPLDRPEALRSIRQLAAPGARIVITLRLGRPDLSRHMHPVSSAEIEALGTPLGFRLILRDGASDKDLGREDILWGAVVLAVD